MSTLTRLLSHYAAWQQANEVAENAKELLNQTLEPLVKRKGLDYNGHIVDMSYSNDSVIITYYSPRDASESIVLPRYLFETDDFAAALDMYFDKLKHEKKQREIERLERNIQLHQKALQDLKG